MILTADWVVPVAGPPIRDGAVLVRGASIGDVGPLTRVAAHAGDELVENLDGCVILPGLINAHTHLSLSVLAGLIAPTAMRPFLKQVAAAVHVMEADDMAASAAVGALESLRAGVTVVGDMVYGPQPMDECVREGVGGVFYWEVLGIEADDLPAELERRGFPSAGEASAPDPQARSRFGLSPHTAYTSGPDLLRQTRAFARARALPFAIHLAESADERDAMLHGTGPLARSAALLAHGFEPPGMSAVAYVDRLGVLDDAAAIHCVHLEPGDAELLARRARGVVLCPRSNAHLGNGAPPVVDLVAAGVRLALGTDSSASNQDLDLLSEARALRRLDPTLPTERLVEMLTIDAARILGLDDVVGTLEPGKSADIVAIDVSGAARLGPLDAVLESAGSDRVRSVMTGGCWRVRDGLAVSIDPAIVRRADKARQKVAEALEEARAALDDGPGPTESLP